MFAFCVFSVGKLTELKSINSGPRHDYCQDGTFTSIHIQHPTVPLTAKQKACVVAVCEPLLLIFSWLSKYWGQAKKESNIWDSYLIYVSDFNMYWGSEVQNDRACGEEAAGIYQVLLCDRNVSARMKGKVWRMVVRPWILYASETVTLKRQKAEQEVAAMKMWGRWRRMSLRGDPWREELKKEEEEEEVVARPNQAIKWCFKSSDVFIPAQNTPNSN